AGHSVHAVTRTAMRSDELTQAEIQPIVANLLGDSQILVPQGVRTVLFAVGYDRSSSHSIHDVYVHVLAKAISSVPESIERFIYISSTGVYGNASGNEVDELSPCNPQRPGGKASLAAEQLLQSSRFASRAIILRLAGLYGPGRIPRAADLLAGRPIDAPAHGWLNLVHAEDAARIVLLAEDHASPPQTYVVSAGHPVQRGENNAELPPLLNA